MSVELVGQYSLDELNRATKALSDLMIPLITQLDLTLNLGLGTVQADLAGQLDAALSTQVALQLQVSNPFEALQQALEAAIQIQASIATTLALGLPVVSAEFGVQISASAAVSATLAAKLAGINGLINAALSVKLPALDYLRSLLLDLSAGPVVLLSFGVPPDTLSSVGAQLNGLFSAGIEALLPADLPILPDDQVFGVVLLTKMPLVWAAMQAILKTA